VAARLQMSVRPCFCSPSYHPHLTNGLKIEGFSKYLIFQAFSKQLWGKIMLGCKLKRTPNTLNEHINILMTKLYKVCFRKNVSELICTQNIKGHILNIFFWKLYLLSDNVEKYVATSHGKQVNLIQSMHFASWWYKATNT
jgi:hypothetical protein